MTSMRIRFVSTVLLLILVSAIAIAQQTLQSLADVELPSLLAIYKDIHAHPELSGHEERTSALIARELRAAGCQVTEHLGKYQNSKFRRAYCRVHRNGAGIAAIQRSMARHDPVRRATSRGDGQRRARIAQGWALRSIRQTGFRAWVSRQGRHANRPHWRHGRLHVCEC